MWLLLVMGTGFRCKRIIEFSLTRTWICSGLNSGYVQAPDVDACRCMHGLLTQRLLSSSSISKHTLYFMCSVTWSLMPPPHPPNAPPHPPTHPMPPPHLKNLQACHGTHCLHDALGFQFYEIIWFILYAVIVSLEYLEQPVLSCRSQGMHAQAL